MDTETYTSFIEILSLQNELTLLRSVENPNREICDRIQDIYEQLQYICDRLPRRQRISMNAVISTEEDSGTNVNLNISHSELDRYEDEEHEEYERNLSQFRDIPVVMSKAEVDEKYPERKFHRGMKTKNNKCPIAQTKFNCRSRVRQLNCLHTFTSDNIVKWLTKNNVRCPICRVDTR